MMDALEKDVEFIKTISPLLCVEIGSGSGAVLTFLATILKSPTFYWATDINGFACKCTGKTLLNNGIRYFDTVATDLVSSLRPRLDGRCDVLIFNPPYVPTPSREVGSQDIAAAWAGGVNGREVTDRLLPSIAQLLSPRGAFYLLALPENQPEEIAEVLARQGLAWELVLERRARNEKLKVFKYWHKSRH